jgi:hypothetical protein
MDAQRALVGVYEQLCSTQVPHADSPGMAEFADQATYVNAHWPNPVQMAHSYGHLLTFATLDHFAAYTRLLSVDPVPFFSSQVTARAGIDAASLAHWVTEPAIGTKARVQRGQAMLLGAAREMMGAPDYLTDTHTEANRLAAQVQQGAAAHGWFTSNPADKRNRPQVGDEKLPWPTSAIGTVLDDPSFAQDPNPDGADGVWWLLSGYTHSGVHILVQQIEDSSTPERAALGIGQGRIALTGHTTVIIAATLGRGVRKAMYAYRRLVGVDIPEWDATHKRWSQIVLELLKVIPSS